MRREIKAFGVTKTVAEWTRDERCKCAPSTLSDRINKGWDPVEAITTKPRPLYIPRKKKNDKPDIQLGVFFIDICHSDMRATARSKSLHFTGRVCPREQESY